MRTNSTRYVILGLLTEGPLSGYDIKKLVAIRFRFFWSESFGQIYPQLRTLKDEGLVVETDTEGSSGPRRKRRSYAITDAGRTAFGGWMATPPATEIMRYELLLKLFWAPWLPGSAIKTYIDDFRRKHLGELSDLQRMEKELQGIVDDSENHWWILKTIHLGIQINTAYCEWAENLISEMEGRP